MPIQIRMEYQDATWIWVAVPKTSVIWIIQRMQGQHHAPQQNVP